MLRLKVSSRRCSDAAFTLLEVLLVVGIVALLVATLVPSLVRIRAQARSAQCQSNLDQQGIAAFIFAHERMGLFPSSDADSIEELPQTVAEDLDKLVSRAHEVFYCPANSLQPFGPNDYVASMKAPPASGAKAHILYWWLANPVEPIASKFLDTDGDGDIKDEYLRKVEAKRVCDIAISTDQSRYEQDGWFFVHGGQGLPPSTVETRGLSGWKNNLYGDGHVAVKRAAAVIPRWGLTKPSNRAGW